MLSNGKVNPNKMKLRGYVVTFVMLFIFTFSALKVPYTGTYIDSFVMEFLFGIYKYVIYTVIFILLIILLFNKTLFKKCIRKRYSLSFTIITCAILMSITCVSQLCFNFNKNFGFVDVMKNYFNNFWKYVINSQQYFVWFNVKFNGGVVTEFLYATFVQSVPIILLVICTLFLISGVTLFLNKRIHWLKKFEYKRVSADLETVSKDVNEGTVTLPVAGYLSDTYINNDPVNLKVAAEVEKKIINIMKGDKIDFKKTSVNIMPIYSQIMFELNSEAACDDILNNKINIFENIYSEKTAILIRGNTITFEILNKSPSKISYKSLFLRSPKNKLPLGLSIDKKVALLNFDDSKNTFIAGEKGSGTTMVMITIIISFAYTSNPKNSEIIILEDEKQTSSLLKTFEKLPHLIKKDTFGNAKCKSTIESFIGNQANKKTLIVFNLYDEFTKVSNVHKELLIKLLEYANKNKNVLVVLTTQSVNNDSASEDIYKEFSNKLLLRTKTEQESIDIIGNPRAYQLFGYGDCLFVNKDGEKDRIQTCYISKNEINSIIAVITTFFNTLNN